MVKGLEKLTPEQLQKLKDEKVFNEQQIVQHLKRYSKYDVSKKATDGIPVSELLLFPEFSGHPFIERILEFYVDGTTKKIMPDQFVSLCAVLSTQADIGAKTNLAFKCFNIHESGALKYEEVYRMYKMMFKPGSLTEDQILDLTFRALNITELEQPGQITQTDFQNLVSNGEIRSKFTIDLQLPP